MKLRRVLSTTALGLATLMIVTTSAVWADVGAVDGDLATAGIQTLDLGEVCPSATALPAFTVNYYAQRAAFAPSNNVWANGALLTWAARAPNPEQITASPAGANGSLTAVRPSSGNLSGTWTSQAVNSFSQAFPGSVTVTPGTVEGAYVATVKSTASGADSNPPDNLVRNVDLAVTWDVLEAIDPECTATPPDTTPPNTTILTQPTNPSGSRSATFTFTGSDDVTPPASLDFQCNLDGIGFTACLSPKIYTGLGDGSHNFQVRARDGAGNLDPTPASYTWSIDTGAPGVSFATTPAAPDGNNGWFVTDPVTVTVTATDTANNIASITCTVDAVAASLSNTSGIGSATTASGDLSVTGDGTHTVSCTATDSVGNTTSPAATLTVKIDTTLPVIGDGGFVSGTAGTGGWYTSAVTNGFTASDATSGLADCAATFNQSSGTDEGSSVTIASGPCSDNAGNTNLGINSAAYKIDLTDPYDITWVPAALTGNYYFGSVPAAPTCTATDDISGLLGCVVTGYSTLVGSHTLTATATDNAGRTATATSDYTVLAWTLNGFYQPVDMRTPANPNVWNTVKGGSTVPLKFEVFAGTTELTSTDVLQSFTVTGVACPTTGFVADDIEFTTTGGTSFRYDTTGGQFIQNWQTPKKPGYCYKVTMTTDDGSSLSAWFILK